MSHRSSLLLLQQLAAKELHSYNLQRWCNDGEFLWTEWPYTDRELEVLKRAARSSKIGCKGGLVNERGHVDMSCQEAMWKLQASGMLDEHVPSNLGWSMLEHFATPDELKPPEFKQKGYNISGVVKRPKIGSRR